MTSLPVVDLSRDPAPIPAPRSGLEKTRDVALTIASVLVSLVILAGVAFTIWLYSDNGTDPVPGPSLPTIKPGCSFDQADQQGRCPGDPGYDGAS